ncbi:hypothetical protein TeGR_g7723, partial [Tetraparma gracilis]
VIAVVGRPNVGKSALVNRLCATQSGGAIVADVSGITRDRTYRQGTFMNRDFEVIDTGGLVFDDREGLFLKEIKEQALIAIEEATSLLLVVDGQKGLSPMDSAVADFLRTEVLRKKPSLGVFVAVNKCESERMGEAQAAEFWSLGLGKPKAISAIHGVGTAELLEAVFESVPERKPGELSEEEEETRAYLAEFGVGGVERAADTAPAEPEFQERETINVAIIGRPNVGKSSLLNNVFGASRAIVSDVAGTTRDSIDAVMEKRSGNLDMAPSVLYKFVDTAGIRRKSKVEFGPEFFMVNRALRAIRRSDVCLLVLDATAGVTEQDRVLAQKIADDGRACLIVCNKWDAVANKDDTTYQKSVKYLREELPQVRWAPVLFISALTGQRVPKIYAAIDEAVVAHRKRFTTGVLNEVLREAVSYQPPPASRNGKTPKIYYANQVATRPPTVVVFCNEPDLIGDGYRRYIDRKFRESLQGFEATPIRWVYRGKRVRDLMRQGNTMTGNPGDGGSGKAYPFPQTH